MKQKEICIPLFRMESEQNSEYNWEITRIEIGLCYEIIFDKQTKGKREKKKK